MSDEMEFLQNLRNQVNAKKIQIEAGLNRFMMATTHDEIRTALQELPLLKGHQEADKALSLLKDEQQEITIRMLAMQKLVTVLGEDRDFIETCLSVLRNSNNDPRLRMAAFNVLQTLNFSSKMFASIRVEFIIVLRALLDDADRPLREMATEELAKIKDEYVQRRLMEELKSRENKMVSRAKAIQLLGYDIHADHYPLVRDILKETNATESEKVEAIHILANDTASVDLLAGLMLDKTQEKEVRMSSASALHAVQPEYFLRLAKSVVTDVKEENDVRAVCLNAMMQHVQSDAIANDPEFLERVSKIRNVRVSPELKKISKKYMEEVKKRKQE